MPAAQGKILVIRGGAIGDFLLTLPVCAALRRQFPRARLEVLGYPHIAQLALWGGLAHAVRSIDARPLAGFFAQRGALDPALQEYFSSFNLIISYLYDPDGLFHDNVARCSKAQFIAGPHRPRAQDGLHATEAFLQPLQRLAIFDADPVPCLPAPAGEPDTDLLALHPGSGSERKNWPEPKWAELLQHLAQRTSRKLLLVGGEAEENRLERLATGLPGARCELARSLPLVELARRLGGCRAFVGHDSGITHLAAALGLPVLVLWGDTDEALWRPRGPQTTILRHPQGLPALPVEHVFEQIARIIE
jgi:heptosyltransferase-2